MTEPFAALPPLPEPEEDVYSAMEQSILAREYPAFFTAEEVQYLIDLVMTHGGPFSHDDRNTLNNSVMEKLLGAETQSARDLFMVQSQKFNLEKIKDLQFRLEGLEK